MTLFFSELLDRLHELHADVEAVLQGLPEEALDWEPGPGMNSIGALVVHLTGAARYWIGDVALQDSSHRDRDAEFRVKGLGRVALLDRLQAGEAYARAGLGTFTLADLETTRYSARHGREYSVGWTLAHALEHTALHVGHIQITGQMWVMRTQLDRSASGPS